MKATKWTISIIFGLVMLVSLAMPHLVRADGPDPKGGMGLASEPIACLSTGATGTVNLTWQGQPDRARLIMTVSGSEGGHIINVNGQPVARAPVYPDGQPCGEGETYHFDISPDILVQGENLVEVTGDSLSGNSWTATNIRLEVIGPITRNAPKGFSQGATSGPSAAAASPVTITFTNKYDSSVQDARMQIPDSYDGTARPLLVAVHPRSADMLWGENNGYTAQANSRGWLYVSPEMHGSWPASNPAQPPSPGAYSYASLESQYDIIGAVEYMLSNYAVNPDRIYIYGQSMGGQALIVALAKNPHVFAATWDNKGPMDWTQWYWETDNLISLGYGQFTHRLWMERECHISEVQKDPTENPFCFQRRSGLSFASNLIHTPITITHSYNDILVPITHSIRLRDKVIGFGPDQDPVLTVDTTTNDSNCPASGSNPTSYYHCYQPDPSDVLDFLAQFTLNNTPDHINITTDESKAFYWLAFSQSGPDHLSQAEVWVDAVEETVTAHISDTYSLDLGFNLGTDPLTETLSQPGMGFAATTYLINEEGQTPYLDTYTSGYFTPTLNSTGQYSLTIAAVDLQLAADPAGIPAGQGGTSTITTTVQDRLGNLAPNNTPVTLTTTAGTFTGGVTTIVLNTLNGQAVTSLTLAPSDPSAQIEATVLTANASTTVVVGGQDIAVAMSASPAEIFNGETVTFSYQISNTSDITLTNVVLSDNYGPVSGCNNVTLVPAQLMSCGPRNASPSQTVSNLATVNGNVIMGGLVSDTDSVVVTVYDLTVAADPAQVAPSGGQPATSIITAQAKDQFDAFPPNGTPLQFTTSQGTLTGGGQTHNTTLNNGQASVILTLTASDELAQVAALVSSISETTTVDVVHPSLIVTASTEAAYISAGGLVTYSYQLENTGDIALSNVTVTDSFGPVSGCVSMPLAIGQVKLCGPRSVNLNQTTANVVMAVGTALSAGDIAAADTATTTVVSIGVEANPTTLLANGVSTATITATLQDDSAAPLPDGALVQFSTNRGTLTNGGMATISGGQGQAVLTLTASHTTGLATVTANVDQASGSANVTMIGSPGSSIIYLPIVIRP